LTKVTPIRRSFFNQKDRQYTKAKSSRDLHKRNVVNIETDDYNYLKRSRRNILKDNYVVYNNSPGGFSLSRQALEWLSERGVVKASKLLSEDFPEDFQIDSDMIGMPRHSALLCLCVEELGSKISSGKDSYICVARIKGDKYIIKNSGGIETVMTPSDIVWNEVV